MSIKPISALTSTYQRPQPHFRALSDNTAYRYDEPGLNGYTASEFIMRDLQIRQAQKTDKTPLTVLDIGSGDGRNTLAMAKVGYQVTALEPAESGHAMARQTAQAKNISLQNVTFETGDCLKETTVLPSERYDVAIADLLTQHLSLEELSRLFSRVASALKQNGVFIFNALIRNDNSPVIPPALKSLSLLNSPVPHSTLQQLMYDRGFANFSRTGMLNAAHKNGFKLSNEAPYRELGGSRARFINQATWGGTDEYDLAYEPPGQPRRWASFTEPLPVRLHWFVWQKTI